MRRAGLVVIAVFVVPFACDKQGTTAPPPGVLAAHDPPADEASGEGALPEALEAEATAADEAAAAEPPTSGGDPAAETGAGETTTAIDGGAAPEPAPAAKSVALPKALHGKVDASCGKDEGVGQKLKSFSLPTVDGKKVSHKSWKNRVLLVNFWGTWCKPCLEELPEFEQLYRRYKKHGLTLVAIATDEDPAPVKEYVDSRKISAKVVIGAEDYAGQYGSPKFPFSFVVDSDGVIRASFRGYRPECIGKVEAEVRRELEARDAG